MKFRVGDIANGVKTSEQIIGAKDYETALEQLVVRANLYCEPVDYPVTEEELLERINKVLSKVSKEDFVEEANRILGTNYSVQEVGFEDKK